MPQQTEKAIKFFFLVQGITLRNRNKLKRYLKRMLKKGGKRVGYLNYIFCSDEYLLEMNRRYLKHNYFTDIITFDLSDNPAIIEAEIYISTDRIRDNSYKHQTALQEEILRVIFHGVLHLRGYKDGTSIEKSRMRAREDFCLREYKMTGST